MIRVAFGSMMVAAGYLLVYAGVAHGGKFAQQPWAALGSAS